MCYQNEIFNNGEEFFNDLFADYDDVVFLLDDVKSSGNGTYSKEINKDFISNLNSLDFEAIFSAAFAYSISRFAGGTKVSFNIALENNNILPLIIDCSDKTISSFINNVTSILSNIYRFKSYSFDLLNETYGVDSSIILQFNQTFSFLNNDLNLQIIEKNNYYLLKFIYSSKFSLKTIKSFAKVFITILNEFNNVNYLSEINYISDEDISFLDKFNQNWSDLNFHDVLTAFNDSLTKYPNNTLVSSNEVNYSYAEGAFIINEIANLLKNNCVEEGDNVAIFVERSEWYLLAGLGVLSIGACYVPLVEEFPDERIKFILEDTEVKTILVTNKTINHFKTLNQDIVMLNIDEINTGGSLDTLEYVESYYMNPACILYTSGTTGNPKGVIILRIDIASLADFYVTEFNLTHEDVFGVFASFTFDVSLVGLFAPIFVGATVDIVPGDVRLDIKSLNNHFIDFNVTHSFITTQIAKMFVDMVENTSLNLLIAAGEKLGEVNIPKDYVFIDAYGPTEATAFISYIPVSDKIHYSSVGFLNNNMVSFILDDEGRRVPVGAVGKLYLSGFQLSGGYLNRDEEELKAYIKNDFFEHENLAWLYDTGDVARYLPDGSIGIIGRKDGQVKVRGNRIELSEIEVLIRELDFIEDVTVQTVQNQGNNELVAYVVVDGSVSGDVKDLVCDFVYDNKPDYMVPSYVIGLDNIPLNVNGKVDKRALPSPNLDDLKVEYVAPINDIEKIIVDAFISVFGIDNIGANDDFIRLGGDSIKTIRIVSLLQQNNINCDNKTILTYKKPSLIAQHVSREVVKSYDNYEGVVDLAPIQKYFFEHINRDNFVQSFVVKSSEFLDLDVLQKNFNKLTDIHDILRVKYSLDNDGNVIQEIRPKGISVCNIREVLIDSNESIVDIIRSELDKSTDSLELFNEHLIDIVLVHDDIDCYVVFVIHHLIVDGVSWNILLDDLSLLYNNPDVELLVPYSYKSWVDKASNLIKYISIEEKEHWFKLNDLINDSEIKGPVKSFDFILEKNISGDNSLLLSENEFFALGIARAFKKTYNKEVIFNIESNGRDETIADVNKTFGWFTTQYPVFIDLLGGDDKLSIINDVYKVKDALNDVKHLGINYGNLSFNENELEFKHAPITFNYLSTEFTYKNNLFESLNLFKEDNSMLEDNSIYGVNFNIIKKQDAGFVFSGSYPTNTYIAESFNLFIENLKAEFNLLCDLDNEISSNKEYICLLSETQLSIYLDEMIKDMSSAYSAIGYIEIDSDFNYNDVCNCINDVINKHPILKARIYEGVEGSFLVCDSYPIIEYIEEDFNKLNFALIFDFNKCLSHFWFIKNEDSSFIAYNLHHIIADATARIILNKELKLSLNGNLDLHDSDLGFIHASNDSFMYKYDSAFDKAEEFFDSQLSLLDDEVNPLLGSVNGNQSEGKALLPLVGFNDVIDDFIRENNLTLSVLFNSVFAYTLSRFTGSNKVCYNFVNHGRLNDYSFDALNMFARNIPLVVDCYDRSVGDYLNDVSDIVLESMVNSLYPYRLLDSKYDLNNDIVFEYNLDLEDISFFEGDDLLYTDSLHIAPVNDLSCIVNNLKDGYLFSFTHSSKYSKEFIMNFASVLKNVLIQILSVDNLANIKYTSKEDLKFLDKFNDNSSELSFNNLFEAFNNSLINYPNNILVCSNNVNYSYAEGAFIINEIKSNLIINGVLKEDNIAIFVERSEWYLLASMGVLATGATYVPLVEEFPDERIKYILDDTESSFVIVSDKTVNRLKAIKSDVDILNISNINTNGTLDCLDYVEHSYDNPVCILYTSGTTGQPKGVIVLNINIISLIDSYIKSFDLNSKDIYGLFVSYNFDPSLIALFGPLVVGASLNIVPEDIRLDMRRLNEYFIKNNITHTIITTQVAKIFIKEVEETSLKFLLTGGEKLGDIESPKNYSLIDIYGPTESTLFVSYSDVKNKIDSSSVGFLNHNTMSFILDDEGRRVPVGAVGRLYLSGYQLAGGYLNREDENNKLFIKNNFFDAPGYEWLYDTGDIVRYLPDGSIGIVGRKDNQVKVRGNRIELSEIDVLLRNLDFIEDVTVQTIINNGSNELVAYVCINNSVTGDIKELVCDYIRENKPIYMVPSYVMVLDEIPLNINGKVDKRALPIPNVNDLRVEYVPPSNEDEKLIVDAFKEVFNQENIGVNDDFIALGGDSLVAVRLLSILDGFSLSAANILNLCTPKKIAKTITKGNNFNLDLYSLNKGCPLNEPQLNVYLDIKSNDKIDSYSIPLKMEFENLSVNELTKALEEMIVVHPILSGFVSDVEGVPYLKLGAKPEIVMNYDVDSFISQLFNLKESLSRFLIIESGSDLELYCVFHHLIFDGLSCSVFENHLQNILEGKKLNVDDSFLSVAAFYQQIQDTEDYAAAESFYESMLADYEEINHLLSDVGVNYNGLASSDLSINKIDVEKFLSSHSVSANALFTSVFAYSLSRFTGEECVAFNIVENGRDRFNNFESIGMFVNTLPLVIDCSNKSISSFISDVSDVLYTVMGYNFYPFRLLANNFGVDSSVIFQYRPYSEYNNELSFNFDDEFGESLLKDNNDMISDLTVDLIESSDNYSLFITYSSKFSVKTIERFMHVFNSVLDQLISVDKLSEINYVSDEDIILLDTSNQTEADLMYKDILEDFNDSLNRYPDNALVTYEDISYSYSEGAFIINEISSILKNKGITKEDKVAVFVERSHWYLLASLGVLATGACYVPIVEEFPDERIKFILEDTEAKTVIVTNSTINHLKAIDCNIDFLNVDTINTEGSLNSLDYVKSNYLDHACILYTSGTTGKPKGVIILNVNIVSMADYTVREFNLTSDNVYGVFTSFTFDVSLIGLFAPILVGATVDIIPDDVRLDIKRLNEHFIKFNVTHSFITTPIAKLFVDIVENTSIKFLAAIGEKLGEVNNPEGYIFADSYGPTESTAYVSYIPVSDKIHYSSVGFLNYNTVSFILDNEGRRVPVGAVGKLYLSGFQLSGGYLNRDEANEKAFCKNKFFNNPNYEWLYDTGDVARYLPDGSIGIIGRKDGQVKIRGNRIELNEVEYIIRDIDFIEDVTVQTVKNQGNNELVAYVCVNNSVSGDIKDLVCDFVRENKPDYMVPSYVMVLDEIPLNVNGKVDKRALPTPNIFSLKTDYVPPRTYVETKIVNAFEEIFNEEKISVNDDFIGLGGDSIKAIKLLYLLNSEGISCSVKNVLTYKTPSLIAKNLDDANLVKKGSKSKNMFLIPPVGGISAVFNDLIETIDFEGNIYAFDDPKYTVPLNEINTLDDDYTINEYVRLINPLFNDGDLLVGYSLGGLYSTLIAEKLEEINKKVGKIIIIDNDLVYNVKDVEIEWEMNMDNYIDYIQDQSTLVLFKEVYNKNLDYKFYIPKVNTSILLLHTFDINDDVKNVLNQVTDDYKLIKIDSTHDDIINNNLDKIIQYLNFDK